MDDCNYLELQSMAREYKQRRMTVQQNKKIVSTTPIAMCGYWSQHLSSSGRFYFYNRKTEVSQWHQPHDWHPVSPESYKEKTKIQDNTNLELTINEVLNTNVKISLHNNINHENLKDMGSSQNSNEYHSKYENHPNYYKPTNNTNPQFNSVNLLKCKPLDSLGTNKFSPQYYSNTPDSILKNTDNSKTNLRTTYVQGSKNFVEFNDDFSLKHNRNSKFIYDDAIESNKNNHINTSKLQKSIDPDIPQVNSSRHHEQRLAVPLESNKEDKVLITKSDKQQLKKSNDLGVLSSPYDSKSDGYTKVFKLFKSITTSFTAFTTLQEGPQFEKESSCMLDSLMQLSNLVLTLNQCQYVAIFKMYLNLVEEAIRVIMEKLLPAECLEDHEDQLQSLLTRLIAVINENKYNDEDDDNVVAMDNDDDDDDGEIVSDDEEDSRVNTDSCNDQNKADINIVNMALRLNSYESDVNNDVLGQLSVNSSELGFRNNGDINIIEKLLNRDNITYNVNEDASSFSHFTYLNRKFNLDSNGSFENEKKPSVDSRINDLVYNNCRDSLNPANYGIYNAENQENIAYIPPHNLQKDSVEKMEEGSVCDEDEGLCNAADDDDDDEDDEDSKGVNDIKSASERLLDLPNETTDMIGVNSITDTKQSPLSNVHDPYTILSEFKHLFDVRLTNHINSCRTLERQADQRSRESNHFMNIPYRVAISALKKARSNMRIEDTIFQLQLHRKQHLENQIKNLEGKIL